MSDEVIQKYIRESETRQFKAVFPSTLNANDTLFGGKAMAWMDEVAYITATRFTRQRMFTVSTDRIKFLKGVHPNTIVEVVGKVIRAEAVRLWVEVEIFSEDMYSLAREKSIEGVFIFAALDEQQRPRRIDYSFIEALEH